MNTESGQKAGIKMSSRRFMVGTSPRNIVPLGGSRLPGGTWYTPEMIGLKESDVKQYKFIIWEGKKREVPEVKKEEVEVKGDVPTQEELETKANKLGFTKFRAWANKKYKVTGRSEAGIIKEFTPTCT